MTGKTVLAIGVILVSVTATDIRSDEPASPKSFVYKRTAQGDLSLTVYHPPQPVSNQPAIVFFFGGGWNRGTPKQFEPQSQYFAKRGMVAICADYRVKSRHDVTPDVCVEDAKSAIRWIRQNATMLGVDPNRIVGSGGSAGAHLATCTAVCSGLDANDEDQSISSKPNALVLFNPVLSLTEPKQLELLGDNLELAKAISPTLHLTKDSPPTLLFYGSDDDFLAQGEEFMNRSKELDHHAEMYRAEGVGHGFFNKSPWLEKTIQRTDEFLLSLGFLRPDNVANGAQK
jgi:acetyl esterase/lipase